MSDPLIGQINMFGGNFAPRAWAFCDGQLLTISDNTALFSLLGTIYGGDGRTTFGLPDLRGRVPVHMGTGSGLTPRNIGLRDGIETVTLISNNLPVHNHQAIASSNVGTSTNPSNNFWAAQPALMPYSNAAPAIAMKSGALDNTGGGGPHNNTIPCQVVNYIIALFGIYPSRS